ncbi:hypothetical protein HYS50_04090 [Candidatus Woesearchaeota archaeon]|nr:hypothetical protein [Candidatus Woesearchaeota archaeon]
MNGWVSVTGIRERKPYVNNFSKVVVVGAILGGILYVGTKLGYFYDELDTRVQVIHKIFAYADTNQDKALDPQESALLTERGVLPKGILLGELELRLQGIDSETLRAYLKEIQKEK